MSVFTDGWQFDIPANFVRRDDRIWVNDQWYVVAESYNASVHGAEFSGKWQVNVVTEGTEKVLDEWDYDREPSYPRDAMIEHVFGIDEIVKIVAYENPITLSKNTGLPYRWFVNVYEVDRGYGGPEEGGWWYDCGEILRIVPVDSWEEAVEVAEQLRELFPHNHSSNSVIYSGGDYGVSVDKYPGEDYPKKVPHYC